MCKLHDCYYENILSLGLGFFCRRLSGSGWYLAVMFNGDEWCSCVNENHMSAIASFTISSYENAYKHNAESDAVTRKNEKCNCINGKWIRYSNGISTLYRIDSWNRQSQQFSQQIEFIFTSSRHLHT